MGGEYGSGSVLSDVGGVSRAVMVGPSHGRVGIQSVLGLISYDGAERTVVSGVSGGNGLGVMSQSNGYGSRGKVEVRVGVDAEAEAPVVCGSELSAASNIESEYYRAGGLRSGGGSGNPGMSVSSSWRGVSGCRMSSLSDDRNVESGASCGDSVSAGLELVSVGGGLVKSGYQVSGPNSIWSRDWASKVGVTRVVESGVGGLLGLVVGCSSMVVSQSGLCSSGLVSAVRMHWCNPGDLVRSVVGWSYESPVVVGGDEVVSMWGLGQRLVGLSKGGDGESLSGLLYARCGSWVWGVCQVLGSGVGSLVGISGSVDELSSPVSGHGVASSLSWSRGGSEGWLCGGSLGVGLGSSLLSSQCSVGVPLAPWMHDRYMEGSDMNWHSDDMSRISVMRGPGVNLG